jgi:hypothetical protein
MLLKNSGRKGPYLLKTDTEAFEAAVKAAGGSVKDVFLVMGGL